LSWLKRSLEEKMETNANNTLDTLLTTSMHDAVRAAGDAIKRHAPGQHQVKLFTSVLESSPVFSATGGRIMALQLPLHVYAAIRGDDKPAVQLAAALLLLETGIYTLDHIMDDELGALLEKWPMSSILLAATSFLSYLPQRVLLDLDADNTTLIELQGMLADGLALMSEGQLADITTKDASEPSPEEIEKAVCGKTGERRALYAAMAARYAGATPAQIGNYAGYARSLGIARQLSSDLLDLFGNKASRDLASGVRTLPLALYLAREQGERKQAMLSLLNKARHIPDLQREICERLRESGDLRLVLMRREVHCQRALRLLNEAEPLAPLKEKLAAAVKTESLAAA
jgi:geranylgeranyl pyrophosphate synthase